MTEFTFSKFIFLDTNIVSHFAKNEYLWIKFFEYLRDSGLSIGVGASQISELADAKSLFNDLGRFLISIPTGILKNWDQIIDEEVEAHPGFRTDSLLMYPLNAILMEKNGFAGLLEFLGSNELASARQVQRDDASLMLERHRQLKSNFPPGSQGKYDKSQADEFAMAQVFQWLVQDHRQFLSRFKQDIESLNIEVFQSIRLFAYVLFYKYYLGGREPDKLSDFGDLFHLFQIPYCASVVTERDLANVLDQIRSNQSILQQTEIHTIEFLEMFDG